MKPQPTTALARAPQEGRPANPACYTALRLQQLTSRSFVTTDPPDYLTAWLMDQGFQPVAKSRSEQEYGRLGRCLSTGRPAQLIILYWNGSVVVQGADWRRAAELLEAICEDAPTTACMFDGLEMEGGAR